MEYLDLARVDIINSCIEIIKKYIRIESTSYVKYILKKAIQLKREIAPIIPRHNSFFFNNKKQIIGTSIE